MPDFKLPVPGTPTNSGDDSTFNTDVNDPIIKLDADGKPIDEVSKTSDSTDSDNSGVSDKTTVDKDTNKDINKDADDATKDTNDASPSELIEIDGVNYNLDSDGNALNKDGSVFMTAEAMAELSTVEDEPSLSIEEVEKLSGIELYDEDGKKRIYENTLEGIAQREADIKEFGITTGKQTALKDFIEGNPDIYRMVTYKERHGSLDGYKEAVDYSKVVLKKDNEKQLDDIIIEAEVKKGSTIDRAKKILNYIKADGNAFEEAQEAQQFLIKAEQQERQAEVQAEEARIASENEKINRIYGFDFNDKGEPVSLNVEGSIYDMVIAKGQIEDLKIPTDGIKVKTGDGKLKHFSKKDILTYISVPVKDGFSQAQLDERERTKQVPKLIKQYIYNLTGGDLSSLVNTAQRRAAAVSIKNRLKTVKSGSHAANASNKQGLNLPVK